MYFQCGIISKSIKFLIQSGGKHMHYYLTGEQARAVDRYTSEKIGLDGIILMERAALALAEEVEKLMEENGESYADSGENLTQIRETHRILVVAGGGNNGGDGVAAARILKSRGFEADVFEADPNGKKTDSFLIQEKIAKNLGVNFINDKAAALTVQEAAGVFEEYDVIVDALFGVGLTRAVEGIYKDLVTAINTASGHEAGHPGQERFGHGLDGRPSRVKTVVGCDIPSGIDASTGRVLGCAVKCDHTVTFGYIKLGMLINEGRTCSANIICRDIGLYFPSCTDEAKKVFGGVVAFEYDKNDVRRLTPVQAEDSNKGTNGKVLIIAGSKDTYGALYLSAASCYAVGAGLVKVISHEVNHSLLMDKLPEAMMITYSDKVAGDERFKEAVADWADVILLGPGIGKDDTARELLTLVTQNVRAGQKLVLDADALNLLAQADTSASFKKLTDKLGKGNVVITPHVGEMSRLLDGLKAASGVSSDAAVKKDMASLKSDPGAAALFVAAQTGAVCVLKDARTVVACPCESDLIFVNTTGNSGMAKGGSGDVLAGITAGILARQKNSSQSAFETSCLAVSLHGRAGDAAKKELGRTPMLAGNIIDGIISM